MRASLEMGRGNVRVVEEWYRRALELAPSNAGVARNLARALQRQGREAEARRLLERMEEKTTDGPAS